MSDLVAALARLKRYRAALTADVVDDASGLTAADLDTIIAAVQAPGDLEPGGSLTEDDLGNFA